MSPPDDTVDSKRCVDCAWFVHLTWQDKESGQRLCCAQSGSNASDPACIEWLDRQTVQKHNPNYATAIFDTLQRSLSIEHGAWEAIQSMKNIMPLDAQFDSSFVQGLVQVLSEVLVARSLAQQLGLGPNLADQIASMVLTRSHPKIKSPPNTDVVRNDPSVDPLKKSAHP